MSRLSYRIIILCLFIFPAFWGPLAVWGGESGPSGLKENSSRKENNLLAMHFGQPHHKHHGEGRRGAGICPQTRTTVNAPEEDYNKKNPLGPSRKNLDAGESLYNLLAEPSACKICHGAEGNGLGLMAQRLSPMPRNFACAETMREISDGQIFWIIRNGSPGTEMRPYKFLSDEKIWQLALYIRHFAE